MVEKDALGGTCLNRGCIPTKSFIHDVKRLQAVKTSPVLKNTKNLSLNVKNMVARKRQVVKKAVAGIEKIIQSHQIEVVRGSGELLGTEKLAVKMPTQETRHYAARNVILATGSQPAIPSFMEVDGHYVQTTDEALDSEDFPRKLLIIGGGVIGLEMATIYRILGSEVTILELLPDIIMSEEAEIRRAMRVIMEQNGVQIKLKSKVKEMAVSDEKVKVYYEDENNHLQFMEAERVLVATGRTPLLEGINPAKLGLGLEGPFIKVNSRLETALPRVYAVGDAVGGMMLAHKASAEGEIAVANILGGNREVKPDFVPRCVWAFTEVGSVGLTEEAGKKAGHAIRIGKFPYMNSAAAQVMEDVNGMVKIVGDAETGEILGVHIIGAHATDLIGEAVMAMTMESAVEDLAEAIKAHPTLSETVMEAAMDWSGLAIHSPKRQ
jgi:dihydrolipoamide dehydrogenase